MMPANRIQRLGKCNEVARDEPCPLMDQLVERVLPVCSRFSPVDGAGIVGDYFTVKCDVFSVALHRQLLQICRETLQILLVRQDRDSLCTEKSLYQTESRPMRTGRLTSKGVVRKCSSIWWKPSSML